MIRAIPFQIDRNDKRPLVRQVVDGVREAILGGYYAPGDTLPPYVKLATLLGVSRIVTLAALRQLSAEGLVEARPRIGTIVRDLSAKQWRGHVVFVYPESDVSYFQTMFAEMLRTHLNRAGYLFTRASVGHGASTDQRYDFALLDAALSRSVDYVVVLYDRPAIFRHLAERSIPYAAITRGQALPDGAVGLTHLDYERAVPDFAAACLAAGVRRVIQIDWDQQMCRATPLLRAAGIDAVSMSLRPDILQGTLFGVEDAGRRGFARLLASDRPPRDTAFLFADDYLARGALTAMSDAGLRAPEDIRLAIWSNAGLGPAYIRELSRMEMDPAESGAVVTDAVLAYLRTGRYPSGTFIGPHWIAGETMGIDAY